MQDRYPYDISKIIILLIIKNYILNHSDLIIITMQHNYVIL